MDVQQLPYPWERQPGETAKAFAAFVIYRDLLPMERSLQRAASESPTKVTRGWLGEWSSKWAWVERSAAWDQEVDRRQRERFVNERERMAMRHAQQAMALQEALMLPARALADKLNKFPAETLAALSGMTVVELLHLVVQATRVFAPLMQAERLSRDGVAVPPPPPRPTMEEVEIGSDGERMLMIVEAFEEAGIEWPMRDEPEEARAIAMVLHAAANNGDSD